MTLLLEIVAGVCLGVCILGIVFEMIPEWRRQRQIARDDGAASPGRLADKRAKDAKKPKRT